MLFQVISNNQFLSWEVIQFPGMVNDEVTNSSQRNTSTSPQQINLQLVENGGAGMVQIVRFFFISKCNLSSG